MIKEGRHGADFLTSHLFWVLFSQSSSYKSDGLPLWTGRALASCNSSTGAELTEFHLTMGWREGNRQELWASHPSGQLGQMEKSEVQWRQERHTFHGTLWFSECPHKCGLIHTSLINNMCSHILHYSLFFSFCCRLLRTSSLTITSPWTVFRNHSSLPSLREEQEPKERDGWSNKNHLRNYQRNTTQPEEELLSGKEESYARKACGASSESSQSNSPNKRMWQPGAYAREG